MSSHAVECTCGYREGIDIGHRGSCAKWMAATGEAPAASPANFVQISEAKVMGMHEEIRALREALEYMIDMREIKCIKPEICATELPCYKAESCCAYCRAVAVLAKGD